MSAEPRRVDLTAFLSYAREDGDARRAICVALEAAGHRVVGDWMLVPGPDWEAQLAELIRDADAFVFLISPSSVLASCGCGTEIEQAIRLRKKLLPVLIADGVRDEEVCQEARIPHWVLLRGCDDF
jgi:TIR domain